MSKYFDFTFMISDINKDQAAAILEVVVNMVEALGGTLGGGFFVEKDEEDGEETS